MGGHWQRPPPPAGQTPFQGRASLGELKTGTQICLVCGGDTRVEKVKPAATATEAMLQVTGDVCQGTGWHSSEVASEPPALTSRVIHPPGDLRDPSPRSPFPYPP